MDVERQFINGDTWLKARKDTPTAKLITLATPPNTDCRMGMNVTLQQIQNLPCHRHD